MKQAFSSALVCVLIGLAAVATLTSGVGAHTSPPDPDVRYNPFRLPWAAGTSWMNGEGSAPGEGEHVGEILWAIDFSALGSGGTNYLAPVKSIGDGVVAYYGNSGATSGLGLYAQVVHAGGFVSNYAHLCATGVAPGAAHQGAWVGDVGNSGYVLPAPAVRCGIDWNGGHLHLEVLDGSQFAVNAWMSGTTVDHLGFDEPNLGHASNNAGGGYYNARDANPHIAFRVLSAGASSTRTGEYSACGTATYYVQTCVLAGANTDLQDYYRPRDPARPWHRTFTLANDGGSIFAFAVQGPIQKMYYRRTSPGGSRVAQLLGAPTQEEGTFAGSRFQTFEFGSVWWNPGAPSSSSPPAYNTTAFDLSGNVIHSRNETEFMTAGDCLSVNADLTVSAIDLNQVALHFGNSSSVAYDAYYDVLGAGYLGRPDGIVGASDLGKIAQNYGPCSAEL